MQSIIYKNGDNSVCILASVESCGLTIEQIARKDVPAGTPYSIVDAAELAVVRGRDGKLYQAGEEPAEPAPTLEEQLAAIEAEYVPKIASLQTALVAATLTGGSIMDGNIASLRTEWTALLNAKSAAMEALLV